MALHSGTRIGSYEILAPLGAGGMGEVYRARDFRLDRTVAIKALPETFARDPERLARFEREAKLLASLNHPNIAAIYGLEEAGGLPYLVLEFVEGENLSARLARGALPVRETIEIGAMIASAIEAAHERGVVHRDLKPGNVMLTPARVVKVLDFGLAKGGGADEGASPELSNSPTVATAMTSAGTILGTAAYMSPEQARGKPVDRRTDIWSFGVILYECLTGRQAFPGETVSDVIAKILEREPEWSAIPGSAPATLREFLKRCLRKEALDRPRDIGDLRRELAGMVTGVSGPKSSVSPAETSSIVPSLAVLYFENLSSDPESEYFCAGMTEDILTDLSKVKGLRVASRNAVARFRGSAVDITKVATELGVRTVLEGSVRRAGERVRISAQLINAADGFHLWAERYDRTLEDVFAVQEEIASSITSALRVALTPAESENLVRNRPGDVRAYDLYLKGREFYGRYTLDSLRYALELFEQAVAVDPEYALAWAGIADSHGQMVQWGGAENVEETLRLGLEAARKAIALDPRLPEGHKAESLVLGLMGDEDASREANLRALDANPRFIPSLINLAVNTFVRADFAGSERLLRRALEIDPQERFALSWLASILYWTYRDEDCISAMQRLQQLSADSFYLTIVHSVRIMLHLRRNDLAAADREIREGRADNSDLANLQALEAGIAAQKGQLDRARHLLDEAERSINKLGVDPLIAAAMAAVRCGEPDRATAFLTRKNVGRFGWVLVRLEPELHSLVSREQLGPPEPLPPLVWPKEAPAVDPSTAKLFSGVRIESGIPRPSEMIPIRR